MAIYVDYYKKNDKAFTDQQLIIINVMCFKML